VNPYRTKVDLLMAANAKTTHKKFEGIELLLQQFLEAPFA